MCVGFAPVHKESYPKWGGTPPINPTHEEMSRGRNTLIKATEEKAPLIAALLKIPCGCDMPEQGGISGTLGLKPPKYGVCYLA